MPRRIGPDLLQCIEIEFEHGFKPISVWEHLCDLGRPVSKAQVYLLYNRWRESGLLLAQTFGIMGRPRLLNMSMLEVSFAPIWSSTNDI